MPQTKNLLALFAALALTAAITYVAIPFLMTVPVFAHAINAYILNPQNPLVTGIVVGFAFALIGSLAYLVYCLLKPANKAVNQPELSEEP